jgi:hypothetical protein
MRQPEIVFTGFTNLTRFPDTDLLRWAFVRKQQPIAFRFKSPVITQRPLCHCPRRSPLIPSPSRGHHRAFDMRILLQQKDTGLYFRDIDSWDSDPSEAMDFLSSTSAIDFCVANKISNVQLVLKFDEQRYDIVLPVLIHPNEPPNPPRKSA